MEFETETERLKAGYDFGVVDSLPVEFARVNLLRPGIVGASGLKVGRTGFVVSAFSPKLCSSSVGDRQSRASSILVDRNLMLFVLWHRAPVLPRRL